MMEATGAKYLPALEELQPTSVSAEPSIDWTAVPVAELETAVIVPFFLTQNMAAWRLQEMVSQLYVLLSKIIHADGTNDDLPEVLLMPTVESRPATLRIVSREPGKFRFIDD